MVVTARRTNIENWRGNKSYATRYSNNYYLLKCFPHFIYHTPYNVFTSFSLSTLACINTTYCSRVVFFFKYNKLLQILFFYFYFFCQIMSFYWFLFCIKAIFIIIILILLFVKVDWHQFIGWKLVYISYTCVLKFLAVKQSR